MKSAMDYAKTQKKHGHIAMGITIAILIASTVIIYLINRGTIENVNTIFLSMGLGVAILLFAISTALFYARYKSIKLILDNPLVHWKYDSAKDSWLSTGTAETIISEHGLYYSPARNRVHPFWSTSSKLESLKMGRLPDYDYQTMNFFFIRDRTFEGKTLSESIHVPIPKGEEFFAEELVETLHNDMNSNKMGHLKFLGKIVLTFLAIVTLLVVIIRIIGL